MVGGEVVKRFSTVSSADGFAVGSDAQLASIANSHPPHRSMERNFFIATSFSVNGKKDSLVILYHKYQIMSIILVIYFCTSTDVHREKNLWWIDAGAKARTAHRVIGVPSLALGVIG